MISCVCNRGVEEISLDLTGNDPIVVAVDPSACERKITLNLALEGAFKGLCIHPGEAGASFSVPSVVETLGDIPPRTYLVLMQTQEGFCVFICLSHHRVSVSMTGMENGIALDLQADHDPDSQGVRNILLCVRENTLYHAIQNALNLALVLTGGIGKLLSDKLPPPDWLDALGWESGIAMGAAVSHQQVVKAVKSLVEAGCTPGFVLIDEGWQHLSGEALASFEADPQRFPKGIRGVVADLRRLGVNHVGVWHGMMGYRGGVTKELAREYDLRHGRDGRFFLGFDLGRTFEFFYDYYGYLRGQGIDFIKVGDQSSASDFCGGEALATELYKNLQSALQAAAGIRFNSAHFNTECLRNENLFYWGNSRIARTAEDMVMTDPEAVKDAIWNNLANSLWMQHLMQPDFDAWLTYGELGEMLSVYHALSGSINVIGDLAGEHNMQLIQKFVLPSGKLLKAEHPLTLCTDSAFFHPREEKRITKAFTRKGGHGILAAFNLAKGKRSLHGHVSPRDVEGLQGQTFALFSHHNGFIKCVDREESVAITLKPNESDVLTFSPLHNGIAVLGAYGYYLAPGPILDVNIEEDAMHISSCVGAGILAYCEREVLEVRRNGKAIPWELDSKRRTLSIDSRMHVAPWHAQYTITFES